MRPTVVERSSHFWCRAWHRFSKRGALRGYGGHVLAGKTTRDDLRDALLSHRDAVEHVRGFHRPLLVRHDDELRTVGVASQQLDEAADVRVVERGLDLVQQVEGARAR